jgi:hypothetical protein
MRIAKETYKIKEAYLRDYFFNEDDPNVFKIVEIEAQEQEQKQQMETRKENERKSNKLKREEQLES